MDSKPRVLLEAYQAGLNLMVIVKGRLVLENCESIRGRMHNLITPKVDRFYIYMGALDYVDSAGWGTLVGLKMAANRNRTKLCFLAPSERIMDVFRISKLDSIFEIKTGSEAEVIRSEIEKPEHLVLKDNAEAGAGRTILDTALRPTQEPAPTPGSGNAKTDSRQNAQIESLSRDAVEHLRQGDYQRVIDTYLKILDIDPEDLSALNNLGVVYEKRTEWYKLAIRTWQRVLELSEQRNDEKHSARARRHLDSLSKLLVD